MHVTTVDQVELPAGTILQWDCVAPSQPDASPVPPSFAQRGHIGAAFTAHRRAGLASPASLLASGTAPSAPTPPAGAAQAAPTPEFAGIARPAEEDWAAPGQPDSGLAWGAQTPAAQTPAAAADPRLAPTAAAAAVPATAYNPLVWIAGAFRCPGAPDIAALTHTFQLLVDRHETLRSTLDAHNGFARSVFPVGGVTVRPHAQNQVTCSPGETRTAITALFNRHCHPASQPTYRFVAIATPGTATTPPETIVLCGFDHSNVDAMSIPRAIRELALTYQAVRAGRAAPQFPAVGSFLEYCAWEAAADLPDDEDPRVRRWEQFLGHNGGFLPSFPLPLGVRPGEPVPQRTEVRQLLGPCATDRFAARCRATGSGVYAGILAAFARAAAKSGGPEDSPIYIPVHTRTRPEWRDALGWFVTNVPVVIRALPDPDAAIAAAQSRLRDAYPLATLPLGLVQEALQTPIAPRGTDAFMISYIDYRGIDAELAGLDATHISNSTQCDDVQIWFSRTETGLSIRVRYPAVAAAEAAIAAVIDHICADLRQLTQTTRTPDTPGRTERN